MRSVSLPLEETPDRAAVAVTGQEGNTPGLRHAGTSGRASLSRPMRSRAEILMPTTKQIHLILACAEIQCLGLVAVVAAEHYAGAV